MLSSNISSQPPDSMVDNFQKALKNNDRTYLNFSLYDIHLGQPNV